MTQEQFRNNVAVIPLVAEFLICGDLGDVSPNEEHCHAMLMIALEAQS